MRRALPSVLPWALLLAASTTAFVLLRMRDASTQAWSWVSPAGHFWIVSAAAIVCVVIALGAVIAATRTRNARIATIALAFISMAGIFAIHGLATPGFLMSPPPRAAAAAETAPETANETATNLEVAPYDAYALAGYGADAGTPRATSTPPSSSPTSSGSAYYNVTGLSSRLAVLVAAFWLAVAAAPWPRRFEAWATRWQRPFLWAGVAGVTLYAALAMAAPWLVPTQLTKTAFFPWATTGAVAALGGFAALRFARAYQRSGVEMHGAVAVGAALMVQAQLSMHLGSQWSGTFWLYHVQLLAGFVAISWGLLVAFAHGHAVRSFEALTVSDVLEQLRSGYTEPIVALSAALEARDGYTLGHGERVAALAVLIGQQMGVPSGRLRSIAAGGLLHDVGKIGVPDAVLHKHGPLSVEEYQVIQEHPARGADMLRNHFDQKVEANVIRYHHERWDGSGYPDGLRGDSIPLEARITAVADVYDALRSNRAYRPAFNRDDARQMIEEGTGAHFDPRCVDAFHAVVEQWEALYAADALAYSERRVA